MTGKIEIVVKDLKPTPKMMAILRKIGREGWTLRRRVLGSPAIVKEGGHVDRVKWSTLAGMVKRNLIQAVPDDGIAEDKTVTIYALTAKAEQLLKEGQC
jgi:hypothetical protein